MQSRAGTTNLEQNPNLGFIFLLPEKLLGAKQTLANRPLAEPRAQPLQVKKKPINSKRGGDNASRLGRSSAAVAAAQKKLVPR